jgi:hypothetical protein
VIISLTGQQKKAEHFQVRTGPDGKPQKTSRDQPQQAQDSSGRGGRFKQRIVAKKKEEYEDYAEQMKTLAGAIYSAGQRCDSGRIGQSKMSHLHPERDPPTSQKIVVRNYIKPGDCLTIFFNKGQKQIRQYQDCELHG